MICQRVNAGAQATIGDESGTDGVMDPEARLKEGLRGHRGAEVVTLYELLSSYA